MFKNQDYKNALFLGFVIGLFLIPLEYNSGLAAKHSFVYPVSIIGFPLLSIFGLWIGQLLFSRFPAIWQFVKFGLVGVSNTAINFGVLNTFVIITGIFQGWPTYLFASVAFVCALFNSYLWNAHWSFESKEHRNAEEFIEFFLITFIGSQISSIIVYWVATKIHPAFGISPRLWINVANVIATLIVMFWNFFGFKFVVFRKKQGQKISA